MCPVLCKLREILLLKLAVSASGSSEIYFYFHVNISFTIVSTIFDFFIIL